MPLIFGTPFVCFDQDEVIVRLLEAFEGIVIGSQDSLLEDARVTESKLAAHGMADNPLIGSLYRKAKNLGPAIPFSIETGDGDRVRGVARRRDISFRHGSEISAGMREKIRRFLESFGVGEVEHRSCMGWPMCGLPVRLTTACTRPRTVQLSSARLDAIGVEYAAGDAGR